MTFRWADGSDAQRMLEVINLAFGPWLQYAPAVEPIDHLRWKIEDRTRAKHHPLLAEIGPKAVGTVLWTTQEVKVKEEVRLLHDAAEGGIDPSYQGRRIYSEMMTYADKKLTPEIDIAVGYGGSPAMLRIRSRRGDRPLANRIRVLFKPLDVGRLVRAQRQRRAAGYPRSSPLWGSTR